MQLTRFTDLGLRILMYLVHHERPEPVTSHEIAQQFSVPHNHVTKIVHRMGSLGWIETLRGRKGGIRLQARPQTLSLGLVLRTLEGTEQVVDCASPPCVLRNRCLLKGVLDRALSSFYDTLDEHTLADVCQDRTGATLVSLHRKYANTKHA